MWKLLATTTSLGNSSLHYTSRQNGQQQDKEGTGVWNATILPELMSDIIEIQKKMHQAKKNKTFILENMSNLELISEATPHVT